MTALSATLPGTHEDDPRPLDPVRFRAQFPSLANTVYLASCSHGARSRGLDDALARMLEAMHGGPWPAFEREAEQARQRFAALIGADVAQVALVPNASTGAYQVASSFAFQRRRGIVYDAGEFPSLSHVWLAQAARGARVRRVADCRAAIDDDTALVSVPLVTYRDGRRLPVAEVAARKAGARLFVDAYQAVGVELVNVDALGCDYLVAGCSKYLLAKASQGLARFLDVALDKRDGRYDYRSYLALPLLEPTDRATSDFCDRRLVALVTDLLRFELSALDGATTFLPRQRPSPQIVEKRCRLALRGIASALRRSTGEPLSGGGDALREARRIEARVTAEATAEQQHLLRVSMLPVDVVHDEYLFIRVLQSFETVFGFLAAELGLAIDALGRRSAADTTQHLAEAQRALRETVPLFSLIATMQVHSFQTFREHTEGASAIQSRSYKLMESLCRRPDDARIDSLAYLSVPEVRARALDGQLTLDEVFLAESDRLTPSARDAVTRALARFASAVSHWREAHYRIAVRMLGERPGTGYTVGTPYLRDVRASPVFRSVLPERPEAQGS